MRIFRWNYVFMICGILLIISVCVQAGESGSSQSSTSLFLNDLTFVSGEIVRYQSDQNQLEVRVYLDELGNPKERILKLTVNEYAEITNGEKTTNLEVLKKGVEVDVEYDERTKVITYIFVY